MHRRSVVRIIQSVVSINLNDGLALASVVVLARGLDPTLDRDLLTLAEEFAARLGQAVPGLISRQRPSTSSPADHDRDRT